MKAVVAAFNQEKALVGALVGAFSVITNLRMDLFEALVSATFAFDDKCTLRRVNYMSDARGDALSRHACRQPERGIRTKIWTGNRHNYVFICFTNYQSNS